MIRKTSPLVFLCCLFVCASAFAQTTQQPPAPVTALPAKFPLPVNGIELTRAARPNVYFDAVGRKSALFGLESGTFEAWAFPLKLFHSARLSILVEGQDNAIEFANLVERVIVRPESTTLVGVNQLFTLRVTYFSPIDEAGSILLLDADTTRALTITVSFSPDLKPMWPGGFGGQNAGWRDDLKLFVLSESRRKFNGLIGSPAASKGVATPAHQLAEGGLRFELKIDPQRAKQAYYPIIIAGGGNGRQAALDLYQKLAGSIADQYQKTFTHYRRLREEMLSIETPEPKLNLAFEWAKAALDKGMIDNPDLGLGLVAGWGTTGHGARPGFGWFFGGDAAINSYAMTGYGDFDSMRAAFKFLAKYQRADGKITHEISQAAGQLKWFEEYPYAFFHADTTPFYIAAVHNLYRQSGDKQLIEELWPTLKKAYEFCVANDGDNDGILENSKAGLGASELGSLLNDLHQDIYLAATNLEASAAMVELTAVMNDPALRKLAEEKYVRALGSLNELYWNQQTRRYAYALTKSGKQNDEVTAWTAVPMMFKQLDEKRAGDTLSGLSSAQISTDWGTRMLSNQSAAYDPIAYNNGGVWPFLTGFVACAEYEYRRPHAGLAHIRQLAQLGFDHALGYHPEILSGDFYRPLDESVPHQLFSTGMVVTPFVRGLLGLRADASNRSLRIAPQLPATWDSFAFKNYRIGTSKLSLSLRRLPVAKPKSETYRLEISKTDDEALKLALAPALPSLAKINRVTVDGKAVKFTTNYQGAGTVCIFETVLRRRTVVEINFKDGVDLDVPVTTPQLGDRVSSLKVIEVLTPATNRLTVRLEGLAGRSYLIRVRTGLTILSAQGGIPKNEENGWRWFEIVFPSADNNPGYQARNLELLLKETGKK